MLKLDEKRTIRRKAVAESDYERGRATTKRLLRGAVLPSALGPMRLGDLGDTQDDTGTIGEDDQEVVAVFTKDHHARRRADGKLEIRRERK